MFQGKPIIGIAGGIGSGKSFVAKLFGEEGCLIINSDDMVRRVGGEVKRVIPIHDENLKEVEERVASTIDDAVKFAIDAPDPDPAEAVTDLYA